MSNDRRVELPRAMRMSEWIDPNLHRSLIAQQIDAIRLCTAPEGWVERYGVDVLISHKTDAALEKLKTELCLWALNVDFKFRRVFARFLPKQNADREAPILVLGDPDTNLESTALERSLCYAIDFSAGYSVGLFIDQRENRRFVREIAPTALLNCFAYTCSFSVAAATVGAKTVSVDLSKKSLARGRENFALNSVSTTDHQFIADDVMSVLPRLARRCEKFDAIILDPPTFSRTHGGKTFQVENDFETLLLAAFEVAARNARILLSTNCSTLGERALEVMGRFCLKASRRAGDFHREPPLPDFPPGIGASTLWLTLR
jgi:23S rRNA (cytosine1962-C5)-methyltransferase